MPRVLLIGLDGADPDLVGTWMSQGLLPHLKRLAEQGGFSPLQSTCPPVTYPAWTTCVTGVNPGKHGIFDFTRFCPLTYRVRFVTGRDRRAPALWEILSAVGARVVVLSVPGTYPPDPVQGIFVSGFDSPVAQRIEARCVYPSERYADVRDWTFADIQESRLHPGWHHEALGRLLAGLDTKEDITLRLLTQESWDFFMVVFGEADTISHHFWLFHDRTSPRFTEDPALADAIQRIYQRLDAAVGALCDALPTDTHVLVVSDHGFGGAGDRVAYINAWLAQNGYLARTHERPASSSLKALGLGVVPAALKGYLFRRLRAMADRAESAARTRGIDWTHTQAWSEELNYFPSIRLNVRGRERQGVVPPEQYTERLSRLSSEICSWEPIAEARPRAELYDGPYAHLAPDLILFPRDIDGYAYTFLRSRGDVLTRPLAPEEYVGGKEKGTSGIHRNPGILFTSFPVTEKRPAIQDIAPTVLALLGVEGPPMDGRSLCLRPYAPSASHRAAYRRVGDKHALEPPLTDDENMQLEERLRKLGYFE